MALSIYILWQSEHHILRGIKEMIISQSLHFLSVILQIIIYNKEINSLYRNELKG